MDGLLMKYFVLKPRGKDAYAAASRLAMLTYADAVADTNKALAAELREWVANEIPRGETPPEDWERARELSS